MNNESQLQVLAPEIQVAPPAALEIIQRAEIDTQIATAHKYPRSIAVFQQRARSMALIDEETAASCIYSRPVGGGKFAEGLSIRAAEIVGASFGNLRVGATIIEQTDRYVKARGFAHDLESNFACATEVIESTVKRDGTPYDERMRIVIAKSCLAKARRDATFQVVPKALFRAIEGECRKLALGEGQSVSTRRARIVQWITKLAIEPKRVWAALGVNGEADLTDDHFATLTGLKTAIAEGDVQIDEAFPKIVVAGKVGASPLDEATAKKVSVGTEAQASTGNAVGTAEPAPATGAPAAPSQEATRPAPKRVTKPTPTPEPAKPAEVAPAEASAHPDPTPTTDPAPAAVATPTTTPETDKLRAELAEKCKSAGIEEGELVLYLAGQNFVPKGTIFRALTGVHINGVLKVWDDVVAGVQGERQ